MHLSEYLSIINYLLFLIINSDIKIKMNLPFLKAKNSKTVCTNVTIIVTPSRYGLVSTKAL